MTRRPDQAAARWADDGVEDAGEASLTGVGSPGADEDDEGGPVARDGAANDAAGAAGSAEEGDREGDTGAPGADTSGILTDVAAISAQRDEYLESLQRLKADFDNYRKRVARLQAEQSARAEANIVTKLLPVLDNLDLAWAHLGPRDGEDEQSSEEARAIAQARSQILDVLGKEGMERVDAVDVAFDPTVHDAVAHTEVPESGSGDGADAGDRTGEGESDAGDESPHTTSVDEVLRAGYRWRGQVLRPAMVRVRG